jgi:hypothetical protein
MRRQITSNAYMNAPTAYPLAWPPDHKRAPYRESSRFGTNSSIQSKRTSLNEVINDLILELQRLGARGVTISANLALRQDGYPKSGQAQPMDPGVAVYFTLNKKSIVLPCDRWHRVECNLMAVVKHIEATRGLARWGVGTLEKHFDGFARLPEKAQADPWWRTLNVEPTAKREEIDKAFRSLAKSHHPDAGGDVEQWHRISDAYDMAITAQ